MSRKRRNLIYFIIEVVALMIGVIVILVAQHRESRFRVYDYLKIQTNKISQASAERMAENIQDRINKVETIAYLYGLELEDGATTKILEGIEKTSDFAYVRYVDIKGMSHTSDEQSFSVADRDYFQKGMAGESGETVVYESRYNGQELVGFYAPVYKENRVIGIIIGFVDMDTFSSALREELNGNPSTILILDESGNVVAKNVTNREYDIDRIEQILNVVSEDDKNKIIDAVNERKSINFSYDGVMGDNTSYLVPIEGTNWFVNTYFPMDSIYTLIANNQLRDYVIFILIGILFIIFGVAFILTVLRQNNDNRQDELQQRMNVVLRSISDDYVHIIDVNLNDMRLASFNLKKEGEVDWVDEGELYENALMGYANSKVAEYDRERFINDSKLTRIVDNLRNNKDYYFEYDAIAGGVTHRFQNRCVIDRNLHKEPHLLISIRDISSIVEERNERETEMKLVAAAAAGVYPFIMQINLTLNYAKIMYNDSIIKGGTYEEGKMEDLLKRGAITVPDAEEKALFLDMFDRNSLLDRFKRGERKIEFRYRQIADDGSLHWSETKLILMEGENDTICGISLTRVIDDKISQENELKESREMAEKANALKSQYIFDIAHEIRTPLNAIEEYRYLVNKNINDSEAIKEYIDKAQDIHNDIKKIVDSVLDRIKIENEDLILNESVVDASNAAERILALIKPESVAKNIEFVQDSDFANPMFYQDELKNAKVVFNILRFAINNSNRNGKIYFYLKQNPGKTENDCIVDFGCEFEGNVIAKEIYEIAKGIEISKAPDTNIDIMDITAIKEAKLYVEAMGGSIEIYTEEGNKHTIITHTPHKLAAK